jgi:hypothetical protein
MRAARRPATWGQFCIDKQLAAALRGDVKKGLFFTGAGALPFGNQIRSVCELMSKMLTGTQPAFAERGMPLEASLVQRAAD